MSFGHAGPHGPGGSGGPTPDWGALAEQAERRGRRRRRLLIGGGALATAAVAAIVATAVVRSGQGDDKPHTLPTAESAPPDEPEQPDPSFSDVSPPAPPDPRDFLSDAKRDTAPLNAENLFPSDKIVSNGRSYAQGATGSTQNCPSAASVTLGATLSGNGCTQVIRATYFAKGVAVTVGVAVFDTESQASKVKKKASGNIRPLAGDGVAAFCQQTACRLTTNAIGRYAYFTVSGYTSGQPVPAADTEARQAGTDVADYTFSRIVERGEAQASAAATAGD
ncbi:hypothetical protein [Streptomyces sp. TP-A0874]|uniref:hypothetical protein n=1 Tax=Streptomyces sp. TP-A0874 TaxID=549819 RepID=UPI000852EDDB|nr:hypothetical protein [Streptomyces sp. TP-A0874]